MYTYCVLYARVQAMLTLMVTAVNTVPVQATLDDAPLGAYLVV
jgi:hypothetical protein